MWILSLSLHLAHTLIWALSPLSDLASGYALGGGLGDITPLVGLGCDQVVGLEMVLYNGTIITANKREYVTSPAVA